jgi:hypothetical protein
MNNTTINGSNMPVSFTGHDSFALRHGWLEKAFHEVKRKEGHGNPFSSNDSIIRFGVGKNMVNAIKHWALASNFILKGEHGYEASDYAIAVMKDLDPYLEKSSTLWKVHYEIAKNPLNTTIYWVFSHLNSASFSREHLERRLVEYCEKNERSAPAQKTLKTDVSVTLSMYCGGKNSSHRSEDEISYPLQELGLIRMNHDGTYSIAIGPKKSLSDGLLISAIHDFWDSTDANSTSIKLDTLLYSARSPGRIFALSETELLDRVARISDRTNGMLEVSETAGIVQIFKNQRKFKPELLKNLWRHL